MPVTAAKFFWGVWAIYVAIGAGLLAVVWYTESAQAALAMAKPVLILCAALAATAVFCEVLEERLSR
jgi:hypothetical protein